MSRGPSPDITTVDILRVMHRLDDPAYVPSEVAAELDASLEGVRYRMNKLVDDDLLAVKRPGDQTVMYWITPKGRQYFAENA